MTLYIITLFIQIVSLVNIGLCDISNDVQVRLVNGTVTRGGRLEIFYNGTWGSVCDDKFDVDDARVVCRMLGIQLLHPITIGSAYFGEGTGPILLDDVQCLGSELNIGHCNNSGWYINNCGHAQDVGVICEEANSTVLVRLVNSHMSPHSGTLPQRGRLEVFFNEVWGTVCDDEFDERDAEVVCRMLGVETNYTNVESFGGGSGPILLDDLNCTGLETNIGECGSSGWGTHNCRHGEDVGVICYTENDANVQIRLVNGSSAKNGRLEVFYNNTWGTVCDDSFERINADVVCRMLGFNTLYARQSAGGQFGQGTGPILLDNVHCKGTEENLAFCTHNGWYVNNCHHSEDVGVFCSSDLDDVKVRLVNGSSANSGRLEVFYQNKWGTVCEDSFNVNDAKVVCRMLGLPDVTPQWVIGGVFGTGSGHIMLDELKCSGKETSIVQCNHNQWFRSDCSHREDVGVICDAIDIHIRLANGSSASNGRLEVFYNNTWGTVCDDGFDVHEAKVVCAMLGIGQNSTTYSLSKSFFGNGTGPVLLDHLACTGSESNLAQCGNNGWSTSNCGLGKDAGVICDLGSFAQDHYQNAQYRLVNGHSQHEGRLEINIGGIWGTVCDDDFDDKAAKVVCDRLGLQHTHARKGSFGFGSGPIWLDNVQCHGNERSLDECHHNGWAVNNCGHFEDVGVICGTSPSIIG